MARHRAELNLAVCVCTLVISTLACSSDSGRSASVYIKASETTQNAFFGSAIALSSDGSTLAVGAPGADAVFVFARASGTWSQQAYLKASNTDWGDGFGSSVALSADGSTLVVGAPSEASGATGIDGDQGNGVRTAGAVYVYTRTGTTWSQQAYVKASNTDAGDEFGASVALSSDGSTLAVGAYDEDSIATGIDGDQADNSATGAGAVYVYTRKGTTWSQQAYVKASNTGAWDYFGGSVALSSDGSTLAVLARGEDSNATGIDGDQADESDSAAGAVYVFVRVGARWSQQAYVKASNTQATDGLSGSVALSGDGSIMVRGASFEESRATGVDGDQTDNGASAAGAVYVYLRVGATWSQQAYVKASNTGEGDAFGASVAISSDGSTLAVGAGGEDSSARGVDGDQTDNRAQSAGAVYKFVRAGNSWSQQAYLKASNTVPTAPFTLGPAFGYSVALSSDGSTLAAGAIGDPSGATGINGNQNDHSVSSAGAVYVFQR